MSPAALTAELTACEKALANFSLDPPPLESAREFPARRSKQSYVTEAGTTLLCRCSENIVNLSATFTNLRVRAPTYVLNLMVRCGIVINKLFTQGQS